MLLAASGSASDIGKASRPPRKSICVVEAGILGGPARSLLGYLEEAVPGLRVLCLCSLPSLFCAAHTSSPGRERGPHAPGHLYKEPELATRCGEEHCDPRAACHTRGERGALCNVERARHGTGPGACTIPVPRWSFFFFFPGGLQHPLLSLMSPGSAGSFLGSSWNLTRGRDGSIPPILGPVQAPAPGSKAFPLNALVPPDG